MTPEQRQQVIIERLTARFNPSLCEVIDESHLHQGHPGAKSGASHFALTITSNAFDGLSRLKQHQLIYEELKDLIPAEVHALRIRVTQP